MSQNVLLTTSNDFGLQLVNTKRPGRFCNFSKKWIEKIKLSISPQLRLPEKRTIAHLKGVVLGFHFGKVSSCCRAPPPSEY